MKISIKSGAAFLALAAVATACTTLANQPARGGGVYLVGVDGGG
jgi:hypothetical protein